MTKANPYNKKYKIITEIEDMSRNVCGVRLLGEKSFECHKGALF